MAERRTTAMIDILKLPQANDCGAYLSDRTITVVRPWGGLQFDNISLAPGWYCLNLRNGDGAYLQLREQVSYRSVELAVTAGETAYARLEGGIYAPKLIAGARPGDYALSGLVLQPLSLLALFRLLAGRGLQSLANGVRLKHIFDLARLSLTSKGAMGVRAASRTGDELGVLTAADFNRARKPGVSKASELRCLVRFPDRLMTADEAPARGLDRQSHGSYTLDEAEGHDLTVYIDHEQRLTNDALANLAAQAVDQPDVDILIADAWEDGIPTCRVAFDPLLYAAGYPLPHARRDGAPTAAADWASQQVRHAVVSIPLASGPAAAETIPSRTVTAAVQPLVSVVIPTRDRADLLQTCLEGLFDRTRWPHEVIVVDNGSVEAKTKALLDAYAERGLRIVEADIPFNFSTLCNLGAAAANGDYLLFMNNDIALMNEDWLARMMDLAVRPDVGAVGARLYYPDGRLQHGGIFVGLTEACGHLWRGLPREAISGIERLNRDSLRAAVTAALMCLDRRKFNAVGGFDEAAFPVTLNDVDLCLRLQKRGWFTVFAAGAEAIHAEGESRGADLDPAKRARRQAELDRFAARWAEFIDSDPWLPLAIMRSTEIFNLR